MPFRESSKHEGATKQRKRRPRVTFSDQVQTVGIPTRNEYDYLDMCLMYWGPDGVDELREERVAQVKHIQENHQADIATFHQAFEAVVAEADQSNDDAEKALWAWCKHGFRGLEQKVAPQHKKIRHEVSQSAVRAVLDTQTLLDADAIANLYHRQAQKAVTWARITAAADQSAAGIKQQQRSQVAPEPANHGSPRPLEQTKKLPSKQQLAPTTNKLGSRVRSVIQRAGRSLSPMPRSKKTGRPPLVVGSSRQVAACA